MGCPFGMNSYLSMRAIEMASLQVIGTIFSWKNFIFIMIFISWSKFLLPLYSGSYLSVSIVFIRSLFVANQCGTFSLSTFPVSKSTPRSTQIDMSCSFSFLRCLSWARKDFLNYAIPILSASVIFFSPFVYCLKSSFQFRFLIIFYLFQMSCWKSTTSLSLKSSGPLDVCLVMSFSLKVNFFLIDSCGRMLGSASEAFSDSYSACFLAMSSLSIYIFNILFLIYL